MSAHGPRDKRAFPSTVEEVLTRHCRDLYGSQAAALVGLIVTARKVCRTVRAGDDNPPSPEDLEALEVALRRVEEAS